MSENQEEQVETDIDNNNGEDSDIAEPLEIISKEVVEVVGNPDTDLSSIEDQREEEEDQKNEIKTDSSSSQGDIYEQVKAQSIQLSGLADMVQSLQYQIEQLQAIIIPSPNSSASSTSRYTH